jgi:hypothetical protein
MEEPHVPSVLTFRDEVGDDEGDELVWEEEEPVDVVVVEILLVEGELLDVVVVEMLLVDDDETFALPMA